MVLPLLLALNFTIGVVSNICKKYYSIAVAHGGSAAKPALLLINSIVALFFFAAFAGFRLEINAVTAVYALLYALDAGAALLASVVMMRLADVATVTVISTAFGLFVGSGVGGFIFGETLGKSEILKIAIMLVASLLVFLGTKNGNKSEDSGKGSVLGLLAAVLTASILSGISTVILKYFSLEPNAKSENVMFFYTNVFLGIGSAVWFLINLKKTGDIKKSFFVFNLKGYIAIVGNTMVCNIGSILSIWLLAAMPIVGYTPVSSALGIVAGVIASVILKEKLNKYSVAAAAISVFAVIL